MSRFAFLSVLLLALFSTPALAGSFDEPSHETVIGTGGVPLVVQEWGNPDGPPILLIHGFSFSAASFKHQIGPIAERARLIAVDLRGHGLSGKPWDSAAYSDPAIWAGDIAAVLAAKDITKPTIVGWSFGGYIAIDYLRACGADCASGLVLVDSLAGLVEAPPAPDPDANGMPPAKGDTRSDNYHDLFEGIAWTARVMTVDPPSENSMIQKMMALAMTPPYARRAMAGLQLDNREVAKSMTLPITLFYGAQDGMVPPEKVAELASVLPQFSSLAFANSGHSPFEEEPEAFNAALWGFVQATTSVGE